MARPTQFDIQQTATASTVTVSITGELDMNTAEVLSAHLDEHLAEDVTVLTLDLSGLTFMDSSGLRFLIELSDRSDAQAWELKLLAPQHDAAALVLRATGADTALPFESR
jgi:stage II sporulation protein AA (anti-sigma F factor antagonist)